MKKKLVIYSLVLLSSILPVLFAADTVLETDVYNLNSWIPKFAFENSSEFRHDIDLMTPGFLNVTKASIKFMPFGENPELGKGVPFSGYIKVKDFALKAEGKGDPFKIDVGDITAQINMYDFYIKLSTYPSFDYNKESIYSSAPMTNIKSKYYGFPGNDRVTRPSVIARSAATTGSIRFGYNTIPIQVEVALGGIGTGNRNDDKGTPAFNVAKGMLAGVHVRWKPVNNQLTGPTRVELAVQPAVRPQTPIEVSFGVTAAGGARLFNNTPMTYFTKDAGAIPNDDIFRATMTNAAVISSLGFHYKLGLTKVNNKNTYLMFRTGIDIGVDPFASDFSTFGNISKKANTVANVLDVNTNQLNFEQERKMGLSYAAGASVSYIWNKDDGEKESWEISGGDTYNKAMFGEKDKKSGVTIGLNYGQNLYTPTETTRLLKEIAKKSFSSLNVELSTYEDNKKGLVPGLGWILSVGVYDLLRQIPEGDPTAPASTVLDAPNYVDATKIGGAIFLDYAFRLAAISSDAHIVPYIAAYAIGVPSMSNINMYFKAGLKLEKFIRFTTFTMGWDSNDLWQKTDKFGSIFVKVEVTYDNT